jgi:hypothetical protein
MVAAPPSDPFSSNVMTPARVCSALLAALEAADGRRRLRKRDQTPDRIGLQAKRALLHQVVIDDPQPADFEAWLMCYAGGQPTQPDRAATWSMARAVLDEWRLAHEMQAFARWLDEGAPSADAQGSAGPEASAHESDMPLDAAGSRGPGTPAATL